MKNSKFEIRRSKQIRNSNILNSKQYDLEEISLEFGKRIINMCKALPKNYINNGLGDQCLRSGTSIGANYREAHESGTKNDFKNKIRIAKKEAKETIYWLQLIIHANQELKEQIARLL